VFEAEEVIDAMFACAGMGKDKSRERLFLLFIMSLGDWYLLRGVPLLNDAGDES